MHVSSHVYYALVCLVYPHLAAVDTSIVAATKVLSTEKSQEVGCYAESTRVAGNHSYTKCSRGLVQISGHFQSQGAQGVTSPS